jgi:5'-deoxynucleotidase YfbR-like HD superfamily hydrolase
MSNLSDQSAPPLKYAQLAPDTWHALGRLLRTGWVDAGVKDPESVQQHIMALRNIAASLEGLTDAEKDGLLDMLEIHDWPEAIHGDEVILTDDKEEEKILLTTKFENEQKALARICEPLGEMGDHILKLWLRFETSDDVVAVLARQIDKYQAIEQALEYEKLQGIPLFEEFLHYSRKDISHPLLLEKLEKLEKEWTAMTKKTVIA